MKLENFLSELDNLSPDEKEAALRAVQAKAEKCRKEPSGTTEAQSDTFEKLSRAASEPTVPLSSLFIKEHITLPTIKAVSTPFAGTLPTSLSTDSTPPHHPTPSVKPFSNFYRYQDDGLSRPEKLDIISKFFRRRRYGNPMDDMSAAIFLDENDKPKIALFNTLKISNKEAIKAIESGEQSREILVLDVEDYLEIFWGGIDYTQAADPTNVNPTYWAEVRSMGIPFYWGLNAAGFPVTGQLVYVKWQAFIITERAERAKDVSLSHAVPVKKESLSMFTDVIDIQGFLLKEGDFIEFYYRGLLHKGVIAFQGGEFWITSISRVCSDTPNKIELANPKVSNIVLLKCGYRLEGGE